MTFDLAVMLAQLAVNLLGAVLKGNPTVIEQSLLDLVKAGHNAYEQQTGKPIDSSLIHPIDPIP